VGFRGPGMSGPLNCLEILHENGYLYDATTLPTSIGPIARTYYFLNNTFDSGGKGKEEIRLRDREGCRQARETILLASALAEQKLLEIPVTTIPCMKVPFHYKLPALFESGLHFINAAYLKFAIHMCRLTSTEHEFLSSPADLNQRRTVPGA